MAALGIPLLLLGAAGSFALYKEVMNRPQSATEGGPYEPTVSDNTDVRAGVAGTIPINGEAAITNPSLKVSAEAGRVRNTMRLGGDPYKNTGVTHKEMTRARQSPGIILFAPGMRQYPAKEKRHHSTQTKKTPETADVGLPRPPDSLSGVMNAHKHGPTGARHALKESLPSVKFLQKRHEGVVPDNWAKYDPTLAADPQADDFFREGRNIREGGIGRHNRHGRVDGPRPARTDSYNIVSMAHRKTQTK